jgi:hypothetical protein
VAARSLAQFIADDAISTPATRCPMRASMIDIFPASQPISSSDLAAKVSARGSPGPGGTLDERGFNHRIIFAYSLAELHPSRPLARMER